MYLGWIHQNELVIVSVEIWGLLVFLKQRSRFPVDACETAVKLARLWGYKSKKILKYNAEIVVARKIINNAA